MSGPDSIKPTAGASAPPSPTPTPSDADSPTASFRGDSATLVTSTNEPPPAHPASSTSFATINDAAAAAAQPSEDATPSSQEISNSATKAKSGGLLGALRNLVKAIINFFLSPRTAEDANAADPAILSPRPEEATYAADPAILSPSPEEATYAADPAILSPSPEEATYAADPAILSPSPEEANYTADPAKFPGWRNLTKQLLEARQEIGETIGKVSNFTDKELQDNLKSGPNMFTRLIEAAEPMQAFVSRENADRLLSDYNLPTAQNDRMAENLQAGAKVLLALLDTDNKVSEDKPPPFAGKVSLRDLGDADKTPALNRDWIIDLLSIYDMAARLIEASSHAKKYAGNAESLHSKIDQIVGRPAKEKP